MKMAKSLVFVSSFLMFRDYLEFQQKTNIFISLLHHDNFNNFFSFVTFWAFFLHKTESIDDTEESNIIYYSKTKIVDCSLRLFSLKTV